MKRETGWMNAKPHFYDELEAVFERKQKKNKIQYKERVRSVMCDNWQWRFVILLMTSLSRRHFCFFFLWAPEIGRVVEKYEYDWCLILLFECQQSKCISFMFS